MPQRPCPSVTAHRRLQDSSPARDLRTICRPQPAKSQSRSGGGGGPWGRSPPPGGARPARRPGAGWGGATGPGAARSAGAGPARLRHVGVDEAVEGGRDTPLGPVHPVQVRPPRHQLRYRREAGPRRNLPAGPRVEGVGALFGGISRYLPLRSPTLLRLLSHPSYHQTFLPPSSSLVCAIRCWAAGRAGVCIQV
jgi:hypothetical protein